MSLFASIAGLASGLLNTGVQVYNNQRQFDAMKWNTNRTIEAQKELAQFEFDTNYQMWKENNEYNSPTQQMARLKAAGLNPNLVYGSGSVVGNTSGQTPKYNAPNVKYDYGAKQLPELNLTGLVNFVQDYRAKQAQISNLHKQGSLLDAQADKLSVDSYLGFLNSMDKKNKLSLFDTQKSMLEENLRKMKQLFTQRAEMHELNKTKLGYQNTGFNLNNELLKDKKQLRNFGIDEGADMISKMVVRLFNMFMRGEFKDIPIKFNF